jgi:superfamily II DNA/RNA helicase
VEFIPKHAFLDFDLDTRIKKNITKKGYVTPTPIQDHAIPHVLSGVDVVGIANTGTGKTAAFLLPLIHKVLENNDEQILIVVPTRELATQIDDEFRAFCTGMGIFSAVCVGGAPIFKQIKTLRFFNNFVIGTPGRIKDLIERRVLDLSTFATVVLDEADRMLDMGFINDMRYFMDRMPKERQTLFFSATMSKEIERLIGEFLKEPVRISVKTGDTAKSVEQDVIHIKRGDSKVDVLIDLLKQPGFDKVIVFGKTKHGVERLADALLDKGIRAESLHGDKRPQNRQRSLDAFKNNKAQVMVATDVAARGIDVSDVSHVINYDIPATYEDYVHRIGRTGRGGKGGKALTFIE